MKEKVLLSFKEDFILGLEILSPHFDILLYQHQLNFFSFFA